LYYYCVHGIWFVSKKWSDRETEETTYKRELQKGIELINCTLEDRKNSNIYIRVLIESKPNQIIDKINQIDSAIEADPLHNELRILDWILYQACVIQN